MAWNQNTIRQASGIAGYQLPDEVHQLAAPASAPAPEPYAGNPTALSANDARRAWAQASGMQAQAEKMERVPGGSAAASPGPMAQIADRQFTPAVDTSAAAPGTAAAQALMTPEERGQQNQANAMNKLGSIIGAVGSFYSGDMMGAANSVRGLTGGESDLAKQGKSKGGGNSNMLSGIMGMFGGGG